MASQLLLRVSGIDSPGITAALTKSISENAARILDMEQTVTHGLLNLMILIDVPQTKQLALDQVLHDCLRGFNLELNITQLEGGFTIADPSNRFVTTVIADEIPVQFIADLTATLAQGSLNIDSIRKLSSQGLSTLELISSTKERLNMPQMKEKLLSVAAKYPSVDVAVQRENLYRRSKRLVVFDMDSTLIEGEVIDELADRLGKKEEVAAITKSAMNGGMDFQESLIRRVGLLKGLTQADLEYVYSHIKMSPGAERLIKVLKRLGYRIAIISGGFTYFVDRLKQDLGVHYGYANTLDMDGGELTGRVNGLIVDGRRKADLLDLLAQQEGILLDQVIAIGDGANDVLMLKKAGLGIAFNAKAFTKAIVGTSITQKSMDSILYLLGITDNDITEMGIR